MDNIIAAKLRQLLMSATQFPAEARATIAASVIAAASSIEADNIKRIIINAAAALAK